MFQSNGRTQKCKKRNTREKLEQSKKSQCHELPLVSIICKLQNRIFIQITLSIFFSECLSVVHLSDILNLKSGAYPKIKVCLIFVTANERLTVLFSRNQKLVLVAGLTALGWRNLGLFRGCRRNVTPCKATQLHKDLL